jgi:DNA-binding CsgD family transcriptional regulator
MSLIEQIYDAAFDRQGFEPMLRQIAVEVDGNAAFLGWHDFERNCGFDTQFGNDQVWLQRYVEHFAEHDILRPILVAASEGEPVRAAPHFQCKEIQASYFYRGFIAPQQIVDNMAVNLIKRPEMIATLAILRMGEAAAFDAADMARLRDLVPHLTRAVLIQSRLIDGENTADGLRQCSRGARDHIVLLSKEATILEIDAQLSDIIDLKVGDSIGRSLFGKAALEAIAMREPVLAELAGRDGAITRLLCEAQELERNRLGDLSTTRAATHAIHIGIVDRQRTIAYGAMAKAYRLTPTEARVLEAAVEQGDLILIGEQLGMARPTARTHLHRIYDKTDTKGFADLCRLAYRFVCTRPNSA